MATTRTNPLADLSTRLGLRFGRSAPTAADRLDRLYQAAGGSRFETVRSGPELTNKLLDVITTRGHSLSLGLPGCGKTHCAIDSLNEAVRRRSLKAYRMVTATKDLAGETLFDPILRVDAKAEKYISIDPAVVADLVGRDALLPMSEKMTREDAIARWQEMEKDGPVWCGVLLDELTRATPQFVDHLLPVLEHFVIVLDGKPHFCPIVWLFAGNPPGMDSTASVLTPAFFSRLALRINLLDVDLDTQAELITGPRARAAADPRGAAAARVEARAAAAARVEVRAADPRNYPEHSRPPAEMVRLAAAIRYLCWGIPVDRKGCAWLPEHVKALIREAAELDDDLKFVMIKLGELQHFGPDSRRVTAWVLNAQADAAARNEPFSEEHLLRTCQDTLQLGAKDTFTEGHRPDLMRDKVKCLLVVAHIALTNEKVRERLLRRTDSRDLAASVAPRLFADPRADDTDRLGRQIDAHHRRLVAVRHPEAAARKEALVDFLNRVARLNPRTHDPAAAVVTAAAPLLVGERFATDADREFFAALAATGRFTSLGRAVAELVQVKPGRERPVAVGERVRVAALSAPLFSRPPLPKRLSDLLAQHPIAEPHLVEFIRLCEALLGDATDDAAAVAAGDVWNEHFAARPDAERAAALAVFDDLASDFSLTLQERVRNFRQGVK